MVILVEMVRVLYQGLMEVELVVVVVQVVLVQMDILVELRV